MAKLGAGPRNLLTSLILVFPLFVVYQIGVIFTLPLLNGADFLTVFLFERVGLSLKGYLIFMASVVGMFAVGLAVLRRRQRFNTEVVLPVVLESTFYALTMGSVIVLVMTKILGVIPALATGGLATQGRLVRLVMSVGAGVYEETVFRLGMLSGLVALFGKALAVRRWLAVVAAFLLSSAIFSLVHHIPPYGEPLALAPLTFRALAGIFFGLLFWFRGFAVAVYTHAFYDMYVLLIR